MGAGRRPALLAVLGEDELHFRARGMVERGLGRSGKLGRWDPPQSPASLSSNVSPLVAFSAVLEACIHGKKEGEDL